jgi:hypothetical protein
MKPCKTHSENSRVTYLKKWHKDLQKTGIHMLRKVLIQKYKAFIRGNSIVCTIMSNHRTVATFYNLKILLFRVLVNIPYKGYNKLFS